jgi:FlaA1/EpsC-like NDP-sugar epimerase
VLFSTDKAVHPTSVLGLTKAVAEWIVAAAAERAPGGRYACVRLGNVVDSAGSILPLFRSQIARGAPVTVTHPDATRFLMTAGEAARLAVVAGALADSRSVFWLDAGPPVRVVDLADRLGSNGSVTFVGLRAGERLHEHQCARDDEVCPTPCERVLRSAMRRVDPDWLDDRLAVLAAQVHEGSADDVRATLEEMHRTAAAPRDEALVR